MTNGHNTNNHNNRKLRPPAAAAVPRGVGKRNILTIGVLAVVLLLGLLLFSQFHRGMLPTVLLDPQRSYHLRNADKTNNTNTAGICAIAKFEEAYLQEWIDYHLGLGFADITLYDNSPNFELQQFQNRNEAHVTIVHDPRPGLQQAAYLECAQRPSSRNHTWLAFFDVDEYLRLLEYDRVIPFLQQYCSSGSLAINWKIVSYETSDGLDVQLAGTPHPVTSRCVRPYKDVHDHVKSIVKVSDFDMKQEPNAHYPHLIAGKHHGTDFVAAANHRHGTKPSDVALFYHYISKSQAEFVAKRLRGRSDNSKGVRDDLDNYLINDAKNRRTPTNETVFDDAVWQLLKQMHPHYAVWDQDLSEGIDAIVTTTSSGSSRNDPGSSASSVALCARSFDAGASAAYYVDEFVDYHRALGFDRVYLFDAAPDEYDLHLGALDQWAQHRHQRLQQRSRKGDGVGNNNDNNDIEVKKDAVVRNFHENSRHDDDAFRKECAEAALADRYDWVAVWDAHEFLVLKSNATLRDWLGLEGPKGPNDEGSGTKCIPRVHFGTSNLNVYEPLPVLQRFQLRHDSGTYGFASLLSLSHNATSSSAPSVMTDCPPSGETVVVVAQLHSYTRSKKECRELLVARNVATASGNMTATTTTTEDPPLCSIPGSVHDSSAWDALKRVLPNYAGFDQFPS